MEATNLLESVYRQYYSAALRFVKSYVRDDIAVEDIVSDSFLELWKVAEKERVERPYSLLITILKHRSLDWLKHQRIKHSAIHAVTTLNYHDLKYRIMALEACNPEELFSDDIRKIVERTLLSLPPLTYRVFSLSRYDHMPVKDIAETVGLAPKSVEYHITKALKVLYKALEGYLALLISVLA